MYVAACLAAVHHLARGPSLPSDQPLSCAENSHNGTHMKRILLAAVTLVASSLVSAQDGMITLPSAHDVHTTLDKLEDVLKEKGMTVFTRIDHAAGAAGADLELRPTAVVIFGNPKVGTPLMNCAQSVAIDLPQKMLAWEDADGQVFLAYNDPAYLQSRHLIEGCDQVLETVSGALAAFAAAATKE